MFSEQYAPDQVTTYEVARDLLGRALGQALAEARATEDPTARQEHRARVRELELRRQTMRVGSVEADQIVQDATASLAAPAHR